MDTQQKTIMITGATGGFGTALAQKFASDGWSLILQARSADKAKTLIASLPSSTKYHVFMADVTDRDAVVSAFKNLPDDFKNIDVLVNNAGLALGLSPSHKCDMDDWDMMIDVNAKALTFMTRQVLPNMVDRAVGHIVNIGSTAGNYPYPGGNVYCASKAFVKQFSLALRADLHGTNVRVSNIEPGAAETNFSLVRFKGDKDKASSVYADTKMLSADDVADAIFWTVNCPPHMNVNRMEIMPTVQSFASHPIERSNG
ncbi:MAG: NAD(P)-dependent oxidoreductase [Alphaproteobacteria bacterium]|nr:MAG: NAD(P)-dependent oxidoreductase [Alphaproteobacteria bacterium]